MFEQAVNEYFLRGWTALALGLDSKGFPKRPLALAWTSIPHTVEAIRAQQWDVAKGIGLALGKQSANLAAIDIDDVEMAQAIVKELLAAKVLTRTVWTIRKRLHLFFVEKVPSSSTRVSCTWHDREIGIELKATGTQVATVPTPGYAIAIDAEPMAVPTIELAWLSVCRRLGITTKTPTRSGPAQYPPPWQGHVPKGERNQAIYIEAHKLREAGMNLDTALEIMQARYEQHYAPGEMSWHELQATVESAYRKGPISSGEIRGEADEHNHLHLNVTRRPRSTGDNP